MVVSQTGALCRAFMVAFGRPTLPWEQCNITRSHFIRTIQGPAQMLQFFSGDIGPESAACDWDRRYSEARTWCLYLTPQLRSTLGLEGDRDRRIGLGVRWTEE